MRRLEDTAGFREVMREWEQAERRDRQRRIVLKVIEYGILVIVAFTAGTVWAEAWLR